ncbi:uncharacterized protein ACLA_076010 [Aspergillus clavatus NRRL 1]|uniref:Uncharacterized protein n=1 Tax=Aspergillus clavatus (strain ATCC 1007 / CBS 513.65 / DSM 816 / NCTC 3887 / NRRL 1 / QM 1276 / 107) TaxID=344612 RepID=A1C840_ASPCL|nr:uncharacterized protein ACLA_076010 [Aspergillus clavatus NRRL 1]EAW14561.1 conserved hypothetical protein [Aspergillus clavatus NRRL 1]
MASQSGNAWAQMKAREQRHAQVVDDGKVAIPRKGPVMGHRPTSSRKSSSLDYDDELALPMPKPRRAAAEEHNDSVEDVRLNAPSKPSITKTRSVTEPARSNNTPDDLKGKTDNREKKKSRVAALKSKLSLKDMVQEFRKENVRAESATGSGGRRPPCADNRDFDEEKLYVPKPRQQGVYPLSAPPFPLREISFGKMSQASAESCAVGDSNTNEEPNNEGLSLGPFASKNQDAQTPKARKSEASMQLDTLLLAGSSPAAHAGELENSGQPHIIKEQRRVQSLIAQRESGSPRSASEIPLQTSEDDIGGPASSISDGDNEDVADNATQSVAPSQNPNTVTNEANGSNTTSFAGQTGPPSFLGLQTGPPSAAIPTVLGPQTQQYQPNPRDEDLHHTFGGGTRYGGYAPRPPHAGYLNTANLEMQLRTNMETVHTHLSNAVHRVCSSMENSSNWSTDQILKQTDAMADVLRLINARTAGQNETVSDLHRTMSHIQCQLAAIEVEVNGMEERILNFISNQINKLRREINAPKESLRKADVSSKLAQEPRTISAELQEPPYAIGGTGDNERRHIRKKQRSGKRGEGEWLKSTQSKNGEQKKRSETESGRSSLSQHNAPGRSQEIPPSTASVHSSPLEQRKDGDVTQSQVRRRVRNNPSQESSGSPVPKTAKISGQIGDSLAPENDQSSISEAAQTPEINDKPANEGMKTPSKKGVFGFRRRHDSGSQTGNRFLRTPRRNKEDKAFKERSSLPSTAPDPSVVAGATHIEAPAVNSPSSIHPALRDDRQQQVMLDRQRIGGLLHSHTSNHVAVAVMANTQRSGLTYSQSHQNMGNETPMAGHLPTNAFDMSLSSSSTIQRDPQLQSPAADLPAGPPPVQPSFLPPSASFVAAPNNASPESFTCNGRSTSGSLPLSLQVSALVPVEESTSGVPGWWNCHNGTPSVSDRYEYRS